MYPHGTTASDWWRIIDTGRTTSDGRTTQEVLVDIMQTFPAYELDSDEGIREAIEDMTTLLSEVANVEEHSEHSLALENQNMRLSLENSQ